MPKKITPKKLVSPKDRAQRPQDPCPGPSCKFCGGLLTRPACLEMRTQMCDRTQRKQLVNRLTMAFQSQHPVATTNRMLDPSTPKRRK